MAKIKIRDLPKNMKISREEMRVVTGGVMNPYPPSKLPKVQNPYGGSGNLGPAGPARDYACIDMCYRWIDHSSSEF